MYNKETNAIKRENIFLIAAVSICIAMLVIRDIGAIHINKYIILLFITGNFLLLNINHAIYFYLFLLPVYFGLPGNYLTFIFVIKCLLSYKQFEIKKSSIILFLLFISCLYYRIVLDRTITVVTLALAPSIFIIILLFSMKGRLDEGKVCLYYSLGVAVLGAIMLASALRVNSLSDLLSSHYRLGTKRVDLISTESMKTVTDPNYYGFFATASVIISIRYILKTNGDMKKKRMLVALNIISIFVAFVGLSRTFIVCIILTVFLYAIGESSIRSGLLLSIVAAMIITIMRLMFPEVFITVFSRFGDETVAGGNGRIEFITNFYALWTQSINTILLGLNIFFCNVHCFPLQYLYGGGILSTLLGIFLIASLHEKKDFNDNIIIKHGPEALILLYSATIPVATMINVLSPIIIVALSYRARNWIHTKNEVILIKHYGRYIR